MEYDFVDGFCVLTVSFIWLQLVLDYLSARKGFFMIADPRQLGSMMHSPFAKVLKFRGRILTEIFGSQLILIHYPHILCKQEMKIHKKRIPLLFLEASVFMNGLDNLFLCVSISSYQSIIDIGQLISICFDITVYLYTVTNWICAP